MAITPVEPDLVVSIRDLRPKDKVRVTLTRHGILATPIAEPNCQLTGLVHSTYVAATGSTVLRLELVGEATTRTIEDNWTVELLEPAPMQKAAS